VGIVVIAIVFIWYTLNVIDQLKEEAERTVNSYVKFWQLAASDESSGSEIQIIFDEIITKAEFPVIITDTSGYPTIWRNVPGMEENVPTEEDIEYLKELVADYKAENGEIPVKFGEITINYFYYGDSKVIRQLQWMPFVELGLVGLFILVGFIGFQNIRRSEERKIWVGMAKETAHQLGTPISSLMGWLEILLGRTSEEDKERHPDEMTDREIYEQMKTDSNRLQKVANRFGQIGSRPEMKKTDVDKLMRETVSYFERRLPFEGKGIKLGYRSDVSGEVRINGELFTWAVENLIKNALQAVDPQTGRIELSAEKSRDGDELIINVRDNGKGIPASYARKIFRPGFTTKKRGWGLGLTLVRRIVREYHNGRVSLVKSKPGETVFEIVLPIKDKN